jgi:hypothetical protein
VRRISLPFRPIITCFRLAMKKPPINRGTTGAAINRPDTPYPFTGRMKKAGHTYLRDTPILYHETLAKHGKML